MTAAAGPLAVLTPESERNLESLRRALRRNPGFAVHLIVVEPQAHSELLRRLHLWSGSSGIPPLHFLDKGEGAERSVLEFLDDRSERAPSEGLVIPDLDELVEQEGSRGLAALNVARDRLEGKVNGPVLLVVGTENAGDLSRRAPDLFDVRVSTTEVAAEARAIDLTRPLSFQPLGGSLPPIAETRDKAARLRLIQEQHPESPKGALVDGWNSVAEQFRLASELGEARAAAEEAQRIAVGMQPRYLAGEGRALFQLGLIAHDCGRMREGEHQLRTAVEILRATRSTVDLASAILGLAQMVGGRGDVGAGKLLMREALELFRKAGSLDGMASAHLHLGELFTNADRRKDAERHLKEALARFRKMDDPFGIGNALGTLGSLHWRQGKFMDAEADFRGALENHTVARDLTGQASALLSLGRAYSGRGALGEAEETLLNAVEVSRRANSLVTLRDALAALASLLEGQGRPDEAARYREEAKAIQDRLEGDQDR